MIRLTRRAVAFSLAAVTLATLRVPAPSTTSPAPGKRGHLMVDASFRHGELAPHCAAESLAQAQKLEADVVRQWRASLFAELQRRAGTVTALVRWDKALILSGLAREERLRVRSVRLSQSVFRIEIDV
jgi:hypothetical protein